MRSPSLFSPAKQARYERPVSGPFQTFQANGQINRAELTDFRKEVRNNISQREPFTQHQEIKPILLTSWKKHEKKNTEGNLAKYMGKSSPKKSVPGGLNMEEIFTQKKYIDKIQSSNTFYYPQQKKVDQLFKQNDSQNKENSFSNLFRQKRPSIVSRQSGRDPSPISGQQALERIRSWDTKLDLQLKQLNNRDLSFYKYSQKENHYETTKPLQTKDIFGQNNSTFNKFIRNSSPKKFIEKIPLTEIMKMQSYFGQLPTADIQSIPRGYLLELQNLQQILQRLVKQSSQIL